MKNLLVIIGTSCLLMTGYAQTHDIEVVEIIDPGDLWVEAGHTVTPDIMVKNNGTETETVVPIVLTIFDMDDYSTVYEETVNLSDIPVGASIPVNFPPWLPCGRCEDWLERSNPDYPALEEVGALYEFIAYVELETDENHENDTTRDTVVCLLSHDVGVIDLVDQNGNSWGWRPGGWPVGSVFDCLATVENFSFNVFHDVPVDLEIYDVETEPDSLVWHNLQFVEHLDWRGNELGHQYREKVDFPDFDTPSENWFRFKCRTELVFDECSKNDDLKREINQINEDRVRPEEVSFIVSSNQLMSRSSSVMFKIPNSSFLKIGIYDIYGSRIAPLAERHFEPGTYFPTWSGTDDAGNKVASGIYLVRMEAGEFQATEKVVVIE